MIFQQKSIPHNLSLYSLLIMLTILMLITGCETSKSDSDPKTSGCQKAVCVRVLGTGVHTGSSREYQLLEISNASNERVFVQWLPPLPGEAHKTVVVSNPYDGIDWTGLEVDVRWAKDNSLAGCYPDIDSPGFDSGAQGSQTCYGGTKSPQQVADELFGFLYNKLGVLVVFGRFYAGETLQDSVEGMALALAYLSQQNQQTNNDNVAVFGISLGGFEALHGVLAAEPIDQPKFGVAAAPLLDLEQQYHYVYEQIPTTLSGNPEQIDAYQDLFAPYFRRIFTFVGEPPSSVFYPYTAPYLRDKLSGEFLIIHDDWDTLVPVGPSQTLSASESISPFWFPHTSSINYDTFDIEHQQISEGLDANILFTFSYSFIFTRLLDPDAEPLVFYSYVSFQRFFDYIKSQQDSGADISWLIPRLKELAASGVILFDLDTESSPHTAAGYQIVGEFLNSVWDAGLDDKNYEENVASYLATVVW